MEFNESNKIIGKLLDKYFAWLIFFLIFLRLTSAGVSPYAVDFDESIIINWGQRAWSQLQFYLFAPEYTKWEMLPSYLYSLPSYISISLTRITSATFGVLEIYFFKKILEVDLDLNSNDYSSKLLSINLITIFYLLCPWHFFYSRIIGTCQGVSLFFLVSYYYRHHIKVLVPASLFGLFFYTPFRLWFIFYPFIKKDKLFWFRYYGLVSTATGALLFLSKNNFLDFFKRGNYNFKDVQIDLIPNILSSIGFPILPPIKSYMEISPFFSADLIHEAFMKSLSGHSPLGFGISFLVLMGIFTSFKNKRWQNSTTLKVFSIWWVIQMIALSFMGPSTSRFILILPSFMYFAWLGLNDFFSIKITKRKVLFLTLLISLNIWPVLKIQSFLLNSSQHGEYFPQAIQDNAIAAQNSFPDVGAEKRVMLSYKLHHAFKLQSNRAPQFQAPEPVFEVIEKQIEEIYAKYGTALILFPKIFNAKVQKGTLELYRDAKLLLRQKYPRINQGELKLNNEVIGEYYLVK